MNLLPFGSLHSWAMVLNFAAHLAAGILLGLVYFWSLWRNALLFTPGGPLIMAIILVLARFAILGGILGLASLEGALSLLSIALGILVARLLVTRRMLESIP